MKLKVLIACEESQTVCKAFRKLGHEAYSNDIIECSGGHPEWHLQMDYFEAIELMDWDLMIAHPPCTHLAVSGAPHFEKKRQDGRQQQAIDFFLKLTQTKINYVAIENPICIMSKHYRKPDQIIHPYYFGDEYQKTTCLWLKNLPKLYHNSEVNLFDDKITHTGKGEMVEWLCKKTGKVKRQAKWYFEALKTPKLRSKIRSKTFSGIAKAMAEQWSEFIINQKNNEL